MLFINQQLTPAQLNDLDGLCIECSQVDGSLIPVHRHILAKERILPCNILYYKNKKLCAFLSLFFFYEEACELAVMVAPEARKNGLCGRLIRSIMPVIESKKIKGIIFSTPRKINEAWLESQGLVYLNSDYQMRWRVDDAILINQNNTIIRRADADDVSQLVVIDNECFASNAPQTYFRIKSLIDNPEYSIFVVVADGCLVGKAHVHFHAKNARLVDIGVLPKYQKRGLGRDLIMHCMQYARTSGAMDVVLDVELENQNALKLYSNLGFEVVNATDYWQISVKNLKAKPAISSN